MDLGSEKTRGVLGHVKTPEIRNRRDLELLTGLKRHNLVVKPEVKSYIPWK